MNEEKMARYRFYYNGTLKSSKLIPLSKAVKWIDNSQKEWSKNLMPQVKPGEFDPNNGSEVTRLSETELHVVTTGGHELRFIALEVLK